jgi:hypothetical protein
MTIESQVVSLIIAKELKSIGVKQESLFYWHVDEKAGLEPKIVLGKGYEGESAQLRGENYSAFTVCELGELLPLGTRFCKGEKGWTVNEPSFGEEKRYGFRAAKTEADARGKMVLFLNSPTPASSQSGE